MCSRRRVLSVNAFRARRQHSALRMVWGFPPCSVFSVMCWGVTIGEVLVGWKFSAVLTKQDQIVNRMWIADHILFANLFQDCLVHSRYLTKDSIWCHQCYELHMPRRLSSSSLWCPPPPQVEWGGWVGWGLTGVGLGGSRGLYQVNLSIRLSVNPSMSFGQWRDSHVFGICL